MPTSGSSQTGPGIASTSMEQTWAFARGIPARRGIPDLADIIDTARSGGEFKLLEFNPFSGADLY